MLLYILFGSFGTMVQVFNPFRDIAFFGDKTCMHVLQLDFPFLSKWMNHFGGVMVSVLASGAAAIRWCESLSGLTKDYKIGICCFSAKNAEFSRKSKN
jgi:hypothetical protein